MTPPTVQSACPISLLVPRLLKWGPKESKGVVGYRSAVARRSMWLTLIAPDESGTGEPGGSMNPGVRGRRGKGFTLLHGRLMQTRRFLVEEEGASLIEYGMLLMLIAMLCLLAIRAAGSKISSAFNLANTRLP